LFKFLFKYWSNVTDSPYILSKVNTWLYINIRVYKVKLYNYITFFIVGLENLKSKNIKIYYNNTNYEIFFFNYVKFIFYFLVIFYIFV